MSGSVTPRKGLLERHLAAWLGAWPPARPLQVVGTTAREQPGWDGRRRPLLGVTAPDVGTLLAVAPAAAGRVAALLEGEQDGAVLADEAVGRAVSAAVGTGDATLRRGAFRTAATVPGTATLPDLGMWVDADDPRVPDWLRPFNGGVLLHLRPDGRYAAGAGLKAHDDFGREISVGTEEDLRGRGLARRLVATAARRIIADGRVPTYLHGPGNAASARVAEAAGFPDRGWSVWSAHTPGSTP